MTHFDIAIIMTYAGGLFTGMLIMWLDRKNKNQNQ